MSKVELRLAPGHVLFYVDGKLIENAVAIDPVEKNDRYVDVKVRILFDEFVSVGLDGKPLMEVP